jgi:LmbE family N-acetylglucosaminyl deacetylase
MRRWAEHMAALDPASVYLQLELGRPDEEATTIIDTSTEADRLRRAIKEHRTQRSPYEGLPSELEGAFLATEHLRRVLPPWSGGAPETALL